MPVSPVSFQPPAVLLYSDITNVRLAPDTTLDTDVNRHDVAASVLACAAKVPSLY